MNSNLVIISLLCALTTTKIQSQVGIGTSTPDSSAILHLNDPKKGLLLTSISLTSANDVTTIPSPATGLLIWNNGTGGLTTKGLYYWNSGQWNLLSSGSSSGNGAGWNTTGNSGSGAGANTTMSLGTISYDDLIFKVNSIIAGRLGVNNSVLFGTGTSASQNGVAIGTNAKAENNESTAIGYNSSAAGYQSLAMGYNAKTVSNNETALGYNAQTSSQNSTALGSNSKGLGQNSLALGYNSQASAYNSTALGSGSNAGAQNATAIGYGAISNQANAIVFGDSNANVGIGTSTPNSSVKIDVNGQYKLGAKGTVQKNKISFEVWPTVSISNLQSGRTATIDIAIPASLQTSSTRATIVVSPANDFVGNLEFGITNPRMTSTSNITFNVTNISNGNASLTSGHFYVSIEEF